MSTDAYSANLQRGTHLLHLNRPREAVAFIQAAIAASPRSAQAFAQLARCYNEIPAEFAKVIPTVDQAIALAPTSSACYGLKAWFLVCQMQYKAARDTAQLGLNLDPNCVASLTALANACTKLQQWQKTEAACRRALEIEHDNAPGLNLLAQSLRYQGRWKEAREVVAHLLANIPDDSFGHSTAGHGALAAGDHLRANEHFLQALRMDPHSDLARRGLLSSLRARIWIIRWNTMLFNSTHRPLTALNFILLLLTVALLFGFGGSCYYLNGVFPQSGTILFGIAFGSLFFYLYLSLLVAVMGDFLLIFDPLGRHALNPSEKIHSIFPATAFAIIVLIVIYSGRWLIALGFILSFVLLALSIQYPLLKDRWLRRRESESDH